MIDRRRMKGRVGVGVGVEVERRRIGSNGESVEWDWEFQFDKVAPNTKQRQFGGKLCGLLRHNMSTKADCLPAPITCISSLVPHLSSFHINNHTKYVLKDNKRFSGFKPIAGAFAESG